MCDFVVNFFSHTISGILSENELGAVTAIHYFASLFCTQTTLLKNIQIPLEMTAVCLFTSVDCLLCSEI